MKKEKALCAFKICSAAYFDSVKEALENIKDGWVGQHEMDTAKELLRFMKFDAIDYCDTERDEGGKT